MLISLKYKKLWCEHLVNLCLYCMDVFMQEPAVAEPGHCDGAGGGWVLWLQSG